MWPNTLHTLQLFPQMKVPFRSAETVDSFNVFVGFAGRGPDIFLGHCPPRNHLTPSPSSISFEDFEPEVNPKSYFD